MVSLCWHHDFSRLGFGGAAILNFAFGLLLESEQFSVVLIYSVYTATLESHPSVAQF